MGASARKPSEPEDLYQDDVFPWFHLIQWSAESATANRVFRYDIGGAQEAAQALTQDAETFLRLCREELPEDSGFSMDDDTNFAEWAGALLEWNSNLRFVRFRLVPRRLTEDVFWSRYFAALRGSIQALLFQETSSDEAEDAGSPGGDAPRHARAGSSRNEDPSREVPSSSAP